MRRLPLLALPLIALAACETPREACLNDTGRELATVESLIREVQGNLARGYAIEEDQILREVPDLCTVEDDEGRERTRFCERTEVRDVERPVAIDPRVERAKLDGLLAQRESLLRTQESRRAACLALPDQ